MQQWRFSRSPPWSSNSDRLEIQGQAPLPEGRTFLGLPTLGSSSVWLE